MSHGSSRPCRRSRPPAPGRGRARGRSSAARAFWTRDGEEPMRSRLPERRHVASAVRDQRRVIIDAAVIAVSLLLCFWLIQGLNLFKALADFIDTYDETQFDEVIIVALFS